MSDNFEGFKFVQFSTGNTAMGWFVSYYKAETKEKLIITCEGKHEIFTGENEDCDNLSLAWFLSDVWQIPNFEPKTCLTWICFLRRKNELREPSESERERYEKPNTLLQNVLKSVAQRKQQQEVTSPSSILNAPVIHSARKAHEFKDNSVCKVLAFNDDDSNA